MKDAARLLFCFAISKTALDAKSVDDLKHLNNGSRTSKSVNMGHLRTPSVPARPSAAKTPSGILAVNLGQRCGPNEDVLRRDQAQGLPHGATPRGLPHVRMMPANLRHATAGRPAEPAADLKSRGNFGFSSTPGGSFRRATPGGSFRLFAVVVYWHRIAWIGVLLRCAGGYPALRAGQSRV